MQVEIGIIGGSNLSTLVEQAHLLRVKTPYGKPSDLLEVGSFGDKKIAFLPRHGLKRTLPPHQINYKANLWAFKKIGISKIISVTSVGALSKNLKPPAIFIPDDFLCLWKILSYYDKKIVHITPELDPELRKILVNEARKCTKRVFKGVYAQTLGPRLETKAEINLLKDYAQVVGMNLAHEATLANELNLRLAGLSSIDNYAHGVVKQELSFEKILDNARRNAELIKKILKRVVSAL